MGKKQKQREERLAKALERNRLEAIEKENKEKEILRAKQVRRIKYHKALNAVDENTATEDQLNLIYNYESEKEAEKKFTQMSILTTALLSSMANHYTPLKHVPQYGKLFD